MDPLWRSFFSVFSVDAAKCVINLSNFPYIFSSKGITNIALVQFSLRIFHSKLSFSIPERNWRNIGNFSNNKIVHIRLLNILLIELQGCIKLLSPFFFFQTQLLLITNSNNEELYIISNYTIAWTLKLIFLFIFDAFFFIFFSL